jgi:hypothetical protein
MRLQAASGAKRSVAVGRTSIVGLEMGAGYVRVSGEVTGELNRSAKGVGEASGPALPAFASGKRGVNLSEDRSDSQERCGLCC